MTRLSGCIASRQSGAAFDCDMPIDCIGIAIPQYNGPDIREILYSSIRSSTHYDDLWNNESRVSSRRLHPYAEGEVIRCH